MIDLCLSALATAWVITFVATTGLVAALAVEAVWDSYGLHAGAAGCGHHRPAILRPLHLRIRPERRLRQPAFLDKA
jgi:hypothetical protein